MIHNVRGDNMLRVWVIEDNRQFADNLMKNLQVYKEKFLDKIEISIESIEEKFCTKIDEILLEDNCGHDLFIIDINLKEDYNGIQLAKRIRAKDKLSNIIFITVHIELMSSIFIHNLKVMTFIDKIDPSFQERLYSSFDAVVEEQLVLKMTPSKIAGNLEVLQYTYKGQLYRIPYNDIIGIETNTIKRGLIINTNNKSYDSRLSMKKILDNLPSQFIQSHRAIILNANHIREIRNKEAIYSVVMHNDVIYPASKKYIANIIECLNG